MAGDSAGLAGRSLGRDDEVRDSAPAASGLDGCSASGGRRGKHKKGRRSQEVEKLPGQR
jgi:hypothetical protein